MDFFEWLYRQYADKQRAEHAPGEDRFLRTSHARDFLVWARDTVAATQLTSVDSGVGLMLTDGTRLMLTFGQAQLPTGAAAVSVTHSEDRDRLPDAGAVPVTGARPEASDQATKSE